MSTNVKSYYENIRKPWGELFYRCVWHQLGELENNLILDFGSGFGVTANYLAACNSVVAVEINEEMIRSRYTENEYVQINGSLGWLHKEDSNKSEPEWMDNMLKIELQAAENPPLREVAFFHHVIMRKDALKI